MERRRDGEPDHLEGVTVQRDGLAKTQVRCLVAEVPTALRARRRGMTMIMDQ